MSEDKILTKEIAEQFIADEDSVDLYEFIKLDDDAAEILSEKSGSSLNLEGITSLSDEAAESLSKLKGGNLQLDGITSLGDETS